MKIHAALPRSLALLLPLACASPEIEGERVNAGMPAAQSAQLQRLVGAWHGRGELAGPAPEGAEAMPASFESQQSWRWTLGGTCLQGEGWHQVGPGQVADYVEYVTWDEEAQAFRVWFLSSDGGGGEGWWKFEGDEIRITYEATGPRGDENGEGVLIFADADTLTWSLSGERGGSAVLVQGTTERIR